ncbi:MAG: gamma-glutamylcyclotransferase [bacterium]|nr:gamma-glutamylcyclotransferase [bacterium]
MINSDLSADMRLATYGTLAPGCVNYHQLSELKGIWHQGSVRGRLIESGWGAELGYPGLILYPLGGVIDVCIFESSDLPDHWQRLDEFEGGGYQRVVTQGNTSDGDLQVSIYVIDTPK